MKKENGFTLAEVLITLGIIGVVAAMTIPTLMNQTGEAQFKAGFKKTMATLNQAIMMNIATDTKDFGDLSTGTGANSIYYMFTQRLKLREYGIGTANTDLVTAAMGASFTAATNYVFVLDDGATIAWLATAGTTACTAAAKCTMYIDVNGPKGPNKASTAISDATRTQIADQFTVYFYDQLVKAGPTFTGVDGAATYALTQ